MISNRFFSGGPGLKLPLPTICAAQKTHPELTNCRLSAKDPQRITTRPGCHIIRNFEKQPMVLEPPQNLLLFFRKCVNLLQNPTVSGQKISRERVSSLHPFPHGKTAKWKTCKLILYECYIEFNTCSYLAPLTPSALAPSALAPYALAPSAPAPSALAPFALAPSAAARLEKHRNSSEVHD